MERVLAVHKHEDVYICETSCKDDRYDNYLFSIGLELFGNGARVFDIEAESMPYTGVYYVTLNDDSEFHATKSLKAHIRYNIKDDFFSERVRSDYQDTLVLDMDNLTVKRKDFSDLFEEVIKERCLQIAHNKGESIHEDWR